MPISFRTGTSGAVRIAGLVLLVTVAVPAPVNGQLQSLDLAVHTGGVEGPTKNRRSFTAASNARVITARYRFITEEVPNGFFGTRWNDSFSVAIRGSSGTNTIDASSMNALGLGAFDATGATAWREVSLGILPNENVTVEFEVSNVGDAVFDSTLLIDLINQVTMEVSEASLFDIDNTPLRFLSAAAIHPYFGGITRIHGTVRVNGAPTDGLADLFLQVLQGGSVVATARLTDGLRSQLFTQFGSEGLSVSTPQLMFELVPQFNNIDVSANSTVGFQVVARAASGEVRYHALRGAVPALARYIATNRFSTRDPLQGGDDWAKPTTKELADHFAAANAYNDFSNMHAGFFGGLIQHESHDTGNDIDGLFEGYSRMNLAAAQRIIAQLTDPLMGNRITKVYAGDNATAEFRAAIAAAGLSDRVIYNREHRDHYHWRVPDFLQGGTPTAASASPGSRHP